MESAEAEMSNAELATSLRYIADGLDGQSENDADCAALRLAAQRLEMPFADLNWYDGYDQAMKEIRKRPVTDTMVERAMLILYRREVTTERVRAALTAALQGDGG